MFFIHCLMRIISCFQLHALHQQAQSQQYALTIVALEEKLLALMDKCQQLVDENEAFKQSLQNTDINEDDKGIL